MTPIMSCTHARGYPEMGKSEIGVMSPEIKENKEIVLAAARAHGRALRYTNKLRKEIVLAAVRGHGRALRYTNKLRGDRGSCLAAVENTMYRTRRYTM